MRSPDPLTALSLIDAHAALHPSHPAILFEGSVISYGQLHTQSVRLAVHLQSLGLGPGGRLCIIAANCPSHYIVYLATLRCGAALFPINFELADDEIGYIVDKSDPDLIVCDELRHSKVSAHSKPCLLLQQLIDAHAADDGAPPGLSDIKRSQDDLALVVHTSGTTARPKGVVATDAMEIRSAQALHRVWQVQPHDMSVCALPLSYTFGMFSASYVALCAGATVLLLPNFHPVRVLEAIQTHRATYMVGVPTMYAMMLEHVQHTGLRYDLSSIRMMAASGAPAAPRLKEDFEAAFGVELRDYYALSECTPIFSFDLREQTSPLPGSVGSLVSGAEVRLVDAVGNEVAPGDTGELLVRSERLTPGYYLDPARTAESVDAGWFKTRDLAWRDAQGHFFIVGRDRDQVISGGHKIASTEVESVIARIDDVAQVAVVGAPHPVMGEVVKAVVVLKRGRSCTAEAIVSHCAAQLAAYKVPKVVEFRTELPVSPAGKILKRQLI